MKKEKKEKEKQTSETTPKNLGRFFTRHYYFFLLVNSRWLKATKIQGPTPKNVFMSFILSVEILEAGRFYPKEYVDEGTHSHSIYIPVILYNLFYHK